MTAAEKYSKALELYRTTGMSITEISTQCGVSRNAFANYIQRAHRDLMYLRHGVDSAAVEKKMWNAKGQTPASRRKYRDAIEACDSMEYITFNISQIARIFHLNGTALANQIRTHYPEILERREKERRRLGIADNYRRGAHSFSVEAYAEPMKLLRETDMTVEEAASVCNVSFTGLRQHILFYHKDLVASRENRRAEGKKTPKIGTMSGNGSIRRARPDDSEKYAEAVELYRTTAMTVNEICAKTGHTPEAFRNHLRLWHKYLMFERRNATIPDGASDRASLDGISRFVPAVSEKYAPAIQALAAGGRSVEEIAREFGFVSEVFREYLRKHRHNLWEKMGMTKLANGKKVLRRSSEKYAEAIEIYRTTTESLKSIADRFDIKYNSIGGFIRRNMPEIIEEHGRLVSGRK